MPRSIVYRTKVVETKNEMRNEKKLADSIQQISVLYSKGKSAKEIGMSFGVSHTSILRALKNARVPRRTSGGAAKGKLSLYADERRLRDALIVEAHSQGLKNAVLAQQFGLSQTAIAHILARLKLRKN
jgi:DNA-binding transcriptional regulator LsrR (DeoR family)